MIISFILEKKHKIIDFDYFACFGGVARKENLYIRDLISYYLQLGFEKFILVDNNYPNVEKLSDVLNDYINNNTVDIIEFYGSSIPQCNLYEIIYEKYKTKCSWISFFDLDEYLTMRSEDKRQIKIREYLSNPIFKKCESISINWLIYTDNNLLFYENRSVVERFTSPNYKTSENRVVKSIVRGNLNKIVFYPFTQHHVPDKRLHICNSLGKIIRRYNRLNVKIPLLKYTYLMHYSTKTAEEYINKLKRGEYGNREYNIIDRINKFFEYNNYTEEKLKMFAKAFNKTFNKIRYQTNKHIIIDSNMIKVLIVLLIFIF